MAMTQALFRIGIGYDVHRLVEGRDLILGGVPIPYDKGLLGYSDADVLIHAIIDAILGALGKGDIGQHFPDSDPAYRGADSIMLLSKVVSLAHEQGFSLNNLDASIIVQKPRLTAYLRDMEERITSVFDEPCAVNVKATTTEGLGFCGREEGIAACAVVSLVGK
ncbi:MAG TPA: 2-C-methyl-D-erythritol 2,4-cyclodiphosphate synthase [Desulfatiglandales bacterium]|nr:2-C-methyl-D-erythritol 2,4-cyclodiphosphate synthase [Desulfatiglandales bacterium]